MLNLWEKNLFYTADSRSQGLPQLSNVSRKYALQDIKNDYFAGTSEIQATQLKNANQI